MNTRSSLWPALIVIVAMASIQTGSAIVKELFPIVGPLGASTLRLLIASVLLGVALRPWRLRLSAVAWRSTLIYGTALGGMNSLFYAAIERVPLGIAVALEITGPLMVAVCSSRRARDFLWIIMAVVGLLLLLPLRQVDAGIDLVGAGFALGAGACWALYILFGKRAGAEQGLRTIALAMPIGAAAVLPFGFAQAGAELFSLEALPIALAVAILSTALPYSLEMIALQRIPTKTFGTLMSLQPAFAAMSGFVILGEGLGLIHWLAIAVIMAASIGTTTCSAEKPESARDGSDPTTGLDAAALDPMDREPRSG